MITNRLTKLHFKKQKNNNLKVFIQKNICSHNIILSSLLNVLC